MIFVLNQPYILIPAIVFIFLVCALVIAIPLEGIIIHWIYSISWSDSFSASIVENILVILFFPILLFFLLITGIVDGYFYYENFIESDRLQIITAVVGGIIITTIKLSLLAYSYKLDIYQKKVLILYIENILIAGSLLWFIAWRLYSHIDTIRSLQ